MTVGVVLVRCGEGAGEVLGECLEVEGKDGPPAPNSGGGRRGEAVDTGFIFILSPQPSRYLPGLPVQRQCVSGEQG